MQQLQAEREKAIRDLEAERHLNLATDYQAQLDTLAAQRENLNTAGETAGGANPPARSSRKTKDGQHRSLL